jgi:hypothetical protein
MRLSEEKIKQAILHPQAGIRERAVRYFAKSYSEDPSIMPLVIKAVENYGKEDAYHLIGLSTGLTQTDGTISWIVGELNNEQSGSYANYTYNLNRVLRETNPALLIDRKTQVVKARHFDPDLRDPLLERLEVFSWDAPTCWGKLHEMCEETGEDEDTFPWGRAKHIIEALSHNGGADCEARIRSVLSGLSAGASNQRMKSLMVELAGRLHLESVVPLILENLHEDDDPLASRCREALTRIGTDSVVEFLAEQFPSGDRQFRMDALDPLEHIHSDLAVATCLRLLDQEGDEYVKRYLAHAALSHFASEAIAPVRQMLLGKKLSGHETHLRDYLVETCQIMDQRFPEYDQWLADGKQEREEHQRKLNELRDDPKALLAYTLQRMQENREVDDVGNEQEPRRFAVGNQIRVKQGVVDIDYSDLPLGGWAGTISGIQRDGTYLVRWSEETLASIQPIYRKRCDRDGIRIEEYVMKEDDLEPDTGGPLTIEQPTNIITPPLSMDNQDDRIRAVFGLTTDDPLPEDTRDSQQTYFTHLKAHLKFLFAARFNDQAQRRMRNVMVVGMCDEFPVDESYGVMCNVMSRDEKAEIPLSELEVDEEDRNYQTVDDYTYWFVNAPQADADEDSDRDWDEEDDDNYAPYDGLEDEEPHLPPPPTRQKVGRNDPCPCGSGKKFKKCCIKKHGSDLLD